MVSKKRSLVKSKVNTRIAETPEEVEAHFTIRRKVFVNEQGLFKESDRDEFDENAVPIICEVENKIVGTVRVYPVDDRTWVGGRLAVLPEGRVYMAGPALVKEAVKTVKQKGCLEFLAYIQPQNVRFFKKLGWKPLGKAVDINGITHQIMEADLERQ